MKLSDKWMEPDTIIPSEVTQAQKGKGYIFFHMQNLLFSLFNMYKLKWVEQKEINVYGEETHQGQKNGVLCLKLKQ